MSTSTSETGHNINLANFSTLITYCTGYGAIYNPAIDAIKIPQLQTKYDLSKQKLNFGEAKRALLNTAINERIAAFDGLEILCTKVTNAFSVSGASDADIKDLKTINAKIQSPGKKKTVVSKEGTTQQGISTSQQSYDSKINFFINFIQYLETKPFYKPNEDELKVPALQSKLAEMEATNANVDAAFFNFNQSLNDRNNEMYNPTTGLVQASKDVKKYARSIFGTNSPEYHQLNSIAFQVIKK